MAKDRDEVIAALRQGALHSKSEYVSIRREDLLLALGEEPSKPTAQTAAEPTKDKKLA